MPADSQEQERLKRLRERQLADRDPLVKQRQFQRSTARREKRLKKQTYTLGKMWKDIPYVWKGFSYGLILGLVVFLWLFRCSGSHPGHSQYRWQRL